MFERSPGDAGSPDQLLVSNGGQTRLDEGDIDCLATARPEPTLSFAKTYV